MPADLIRALSVPLAANKKLSRKQYAEVERFLDEWKKEALAAVKQHPKRSYALGRAQSEAFLKLIGHTMSSGELFGGEGPTMAASLDWLKTYTFHELDTALSVYVSKIKDAILYGLSSAVNPTQVASWMYKATHDSEVNWRMIARTEAVRANAAGRLAVCREQGYDKVWSPPHVGSCKKCRRLLENNVFPLKKVEGVTNYGRDARQWVACIPLHPHCRHVWLPYIPEVYDDMQAQYAAVKDAGLTDEVLDEMFEESGQLKPEYANDPRLAAFKDHDPFAHVMANTILKVREGRLDVRKGYFDNPQRGLDPLLWDDMKLRSEVRESLVEFWRQTLGPDAPLWSQVFLLGGATSAQWEGIRRPEPDPDVDLQVVVDYDELRSLRPPFALLTTPEIHGVLVTALRAGIAGREIVPGVKLDAFIRPETDYASFVADVEQTGQALYALQPSEWVIAPDLSAPPHEHYGTPLIEGVGAEVADAHPDWLSDAAEVATGLTKLLQWYSDGDPDALTALREAYTRLHDARMEAFAGDGGNVGRGNFIWQYLVNFGPLMQVKHLLYPEPMEKCWPAYTFREAEESIVVWKSQTPETWPLPRFARLRVGDEYTEVVERADAGVYETTIGKIAHAEVDEYAILKAESTPTAQGVEHWITVHPNGQDDKGIPVLVRNMADGSMMVIGGAGGHLDHLRLDQRRRMDQKPKGETTDELPETPQVEEAPVSEAEAQARAEEREQAYTQAKEQAAVAQERKRVIADQIESYIKDLPLKPHMDRSTGEMTTPTWDSLDPKVANALIKDTINDAIISLAYPKNAVKDTQESGIQLPDTGKSQSNELQDPLVAEDGEAGEDLMRQAEEAQEEAKKTREPKPKVAQLTLEQAQALAALKAQMQFENKKLMGFNKVVRGEGKIADALALDYTDADISDAIASRVSAEIRTDVARQITQAVDGETNQRSLNKAMTQGAYDTVDTFAQAVLGHSAIGRDVHDLLGTAGMAQLVAWKLHKEAAAGNVDLDAATRALDDLSNEREVTVSNRALARAREAAATAKAMREELIKAEAGESLRTKTSIRSVAIQKTNEAATSLGMAIAGHEAASALKLAMRSSFAEKELRIGGFRSQAALEDAATRCGLDSSQFKIKKHGPGDYELRLNPEDLESLFEATPDPKGALREKVEAIRSLDDEDALVQAERRNTPGFSGLLEPAQAKGKLFLRAAGNGLLAFAPGVGKTHTAVAAACDVLAQDPDAKIVIVAPASVQQEWLDTIKQTTGFSAQMVGWREGVDKATGESKMVQDPKLVAKHTGNPCTFNIVSFDTARNHPEKLAAIGAKIVIGDELQKIKNPNTSVNRAMSAFSQGAEHRWGLTGTPLEKNVGEFHSIAKWVKGDEEGLADLGDQKEFKKKFGDLAQYQHLTAEDRIRQFREGVGECVYQLDASEGGTPLPPKNGPTDHGETQTVNVDLTPEHEAAIKRKIAEIDQAHDEWLEAKKLDPTVPRPSVSEFGGARALIGTRLNPDENEVPVPSHFEAIDKLIDDAPDVDYRGQRVMDQLLHADKTGTYKAKTVIFSSKIDSNGLPRLKAFLESRGKKVFVVTGDGAGKTRQTLKQYLAYDGPCVLLATDTIQTGVSLQFGSNRGNFQWGATNMIHLDTPDNNAAIAQREARIHRKGAAAPVSTYKLDFGTGAEAIQRDRLSRERRTQDLVGNPEDEVRTLEGGRTETLPQRYEEAKQDETKGEGDEYVTGTDEKGRKKKRKYPKVAG